MLISTLINTLLYNSQGTSSSEEEQLRLAIELSLRDSRTSQNLSDPPLSGDLYHDPDPLRDHLHDPYSDQYSSVVNRVPNKSVEDLYRASSTGDTSHTTRPSGNGVSAINNNGLPFGAMKDVHVNNILATDEDKICDFERISFTGVGDRDDPPSRYQLFEPGPEGVGRSSSTSSSAYCSALSDMSSPHPQPHPTRTRSDSGTWSTVCDRTTDQSMGTGNQYEHYFFGPVDDCSHVTDDDPGPQLDAVLRTLSKLTTRLEDNNDGGRDDMEEDDSFLENLLHNDTSGLPPLAAGEDDSNETTSPAGGSLAPPELEHDTLTEQWSHVGRHDLQQPESDDEDQPVFV